MKINKVVIYGERCSGTNYLQNLLLDNFNNFILSNPTDMSKNSKYGHKHFFGYKDLKNEDTNDVLFIGIIRNLPDWINSLYRAKYHFPRVLLKASFNSYLKNIMYSVNNTEIMEDRNTEIMEDRNMETGYRYKNIFELRHIKNKYLVDIMPTLVKNYCLITYDNLITNFEDVMNQFKKYLQVKNNIQFPVNVYSSNFGRSIFKKKDNEYPDDLIIPKADLTYEKILFPEWYEMINEEYKKNTILY